MLTVKAGPRDGDEWILNGSKIFITNGIHADLVIVAAITDPGKGAKGTSLFLVDAHSPGFEKSKKIDKIGQHTSDTALLFFNDVRLPADAELNRARAESIRGGGLRHGQRGDAVEAALRKP